MLTALMIVLIASLNDPQTTDLVAVGPFFRGRVEFSDGSPAAGASVMATAFRGTTPCGGGSTTTDSVGRFSIPTGSRTPGGAVIRHIQPNCDRIRFSAGLREGLWLKTGADVFYLGPNGSEPEMALQTSGSPEPVLIRLGGKGGEVSIRVQDTDPSRFVHSTLVIERLDADGRDLGALETATGTSGEATTVLLPQGTYTLTLQQYPCGAKTYFAAHAVFPLEVRAGDRTEKVISVDTRALESMKSSDNPSGTTCNR